MPNPINPHTINAITMYNIIWLPVTIESRTSAVDISSSFSAMFPGVESISVNPLSLYASYISAVLVRIPRPP